MVLLMESLENGTAYGNLEGLLDETSLGKEYVTALGYSVRFIDGKVNMSKVQLLIWVFKLYNIKYLDMEILMLHSMKSLEDGTAHINIDGLFDGM